MDLNPSAQVDSNELSSIVSDSSKLSLEDHLQLALEAFKNQEKPIRKPISVRKITRIYGVSKFTLHSRVS